MTDSGALRSSQRDPLMAASGSEPSCAANTRIARRDPEAGALGPFLRPSTAPVRDRRNPNRPPVRAAAFWRPWTEGRRQKRACARTRPDGLCRRGPVLQHQVRYGAERPEAVSRSDTPREADEGGDAIIARCRPRSYAIHAGRTPRTANARAMRRILRSGSAGSSARSFSCSNWRLASESETQYPGAGPWPPRNGDQ